MYKDTQSKYLYPNKWIYKTNSIKILHVYKKNQIKHQKINISRFTFYPNTLVYKTNSNKIFTCISKNANKTSKAKHVYIHHCG